MRRSGYGRRVFCRSGPLPGIQEAAALPLDRVLLMLLCAGFIPAAARKSAQALEIKIISSPRLMIKFVTKGVQCC